jgi:pilus assembly protein CpaB
LLSEAPVIRIFVLILALAAGGAAAWLALSARVPQTAAVVAPPPPPLPTQDVLVAAIDLPQGEPLKKEALRWQTWPEQAVTKAYIRKSDQPDALEKYTGQIVRSRFVSGEPIRDDKLVSANSGLLASLLSPGKRAVAVRISAESSAGGFVLPGDRVDVMQTQTAGDGSNARVTKTILRNVTVLAVDQVVDDASQQKSAVVAKTATLELDPPQAEALIAAESGGALSLVLRSVADNGEIVPAVQQQTRQTVRIFRGGRTDTVVNVQ